MTEEKQAGPHSDPEILTPQTPVSSRTEAPIYLSIRDVIAQEIRAGHLTVGDRLPSERELAEQHGVARMTARKALGHLEAEGLIFRSERRGYFVSPPRIRFDPTSAVNLMRQLREQGLMTENIYLGRQVMEATEWLAAQFRVDVGTPLALERCVVAVEGRRVIYSEDFLLLDALPGYADRPYISPMTQNIRRHYGVHPYPTSFRIRYGSLSYVAAQQLGVAADTAGMNVAQVQEFDGRVVMVNRSDCLGDALEMVATLAPPPAER